MDTKQIRAWAALAIAKDEAERNPMWREIERTYHLEYIRPKGTKDIAGYHAVVKPGPYKDVLVTKNTFMEATPKVKIQPWAENLGGKVVANKREQALMWWLSKADRRNGSSVQADILESAALYGTVTAHVRHVDYAARAQADKTGKVRAAFRRQHGPFAVKVYNPMDVHWSVSDDGLERVVSVSVRPAQEVVDSWGKAAAKLKTKLNASREGEAWKFKYVTEFYYCDLSVTYVWCVPCVTTTAAGAESADAIDILNEENKTGFIPWVCEDLASGLETNGKYKTKPLLWYVVQSGSWETDCTLASLQMTQGIQNAGKPDWIHNGPVGDVDLTPDYDQIVGGVVHELPGHTLRETQPAPFDQGLQVLQGNLGQYQSETGVSQALAGNTSAETFAGQNQQITQGKASVAGVKAVAEAALTEICYQFLQWLKVVGEPIRARGAEKAFEMDEYEIKPGEVDIETTYITVELSTENEGTRIQQANVGAIGKQVGLSDETALEWMGIADPQGEMKKRALEELSQALLGITISEMQAASQMKVQQAQMQMQMQAQQALQAAAQQPPAPQGPPGGDASYFNQQPLSPPTQQIGPQISGQGYNSAVGGIPPAQVNPNATRESQTGLDANGVPLQ